MSKEAAVRGNPITAALRARDRLCPPLQVANGRRGDMLPTPDSLAADAVKAAWLPMIPGQPVPMLWEQVNDGDPCYDD